MLQRLMLLMAAFALFLSYARADELSTNSVHMMNAPKWVRKSRVHRVTDRIERALEWNIRRVRVRWYSDEAEFQKVVNLPGDTSSVLAVTRRSENAIHIGPRVDTENFDGTFGHELAHVILYQKYKDAIPKWLEEGLANYVAKRGTIDYKWLATQPTVDVRSLAHPFGPTTAVSVSPKYHYMASTALMEMIASKCRIVDLLQLSVGHGLENYLATFCRISDLNSEFGKWLARKSATKSKSR